MTNTDKLASEFLNYSKSFTSEIELYKVLKSRTYKIGEANVLVRAASEGNRNYFFGINYLTIEEISNLDNPFIAFICGSIDRTLIIPAHILFKQLNNISHDRNGEYKINIDKELNIALKGRGKRLDCSSYINKWELLKDPPVSFSDKSSVEESYHSVLQGRIVEIGNIRGYQTYCPDKSKRFNDKLLADISTLKECPPLQFSDYKLLRQIDVLWFKERGTNLVPKNAFEIELTTGIWSGVGRMSTLLEYSDVGFYVISNSKKKFKQIIQTLPIVHGRFNHIEAHLVSELYSAELQLTQLRKDIGL
ncbi:MAG: hypothetical protein WBN42_13850 [Ignavibacteriaceae bacterium]